MPGLDFLSVGKAVEKLPDGPLGADWDLDTYELETDVQIADEKRRPLADVEVAVSRDTAAATSLVIRLELGDRSWRVRFTPLGSTYFQAIDDLSALDVIEKQDSIPMLQYLNNFPPRIFFSDTSVVRGREIFPPFDDVEDYDTKQIQALDWVANKVDITAEFWSDKKPKKPGKKSIQEYLRDR